MFALCIGDSTEFFDDGTGVRIAIAGWFVVCLATGAAWQMLCRRDFVDRFVWLAALFVLVMAAKILFGSLPGHFDANIFPVLTVPSIAAGVILAEARLRGREL